MPIESLMAGAKILQKPLNDLYDLGKDVAKTHLSRWRSTKTINQLYKKISVVQKVKTIWQVDKEVKLLSFYYPSKLIIDGKSKAILSVRDLPPANHIVLQGTVGQGKSIFLRFLCIRELSQGSRIPVFLELRRLEQGRSLRSFIYDGLRNLGFNIDNQLFYFYVHSGKFLFLLDAFDELDKDLVTSAIDELEGFAQTYPQLQILVTSRPDSGIERSTHFRVYKLAPLTENDHRAFLEKILPEKQKVSEILKAIKQNSGKIGSLLTTPLMMTLLVIIYKAEQSIPNELSDFYDNLFQTLLSRHDQSKPGFVRKRYCKLGERQIQELFEAFCFVTRQKDLSALSEEQMYESVKIGAKHAGISCEEKSFLQDMTKVACLMQEEGFKYYFIHKSVQEYHAASFIRHCPDEMAITFYAKLQEGSHWHSWRQELTFLSQIDKYRFTKYFRLPQLAATLKRFGVERNGPKTELDDSDINTIFKNSLFAFKQSEKGFVIVSGTLGQAMDYVLSDLELECFHQFWLKLSSTQIFPLEIADLLEEIKSGSETLHKVKIPAFITGTQTTRKMHAAVNKVFGELLTYRDGAEAFIAREEGKKALLDLQ